MRSAATGTPTAFSLPADHPGVSDRAYRARRAQIAEVGARFEPGRPIPTVHYTDEEDALWRLASTELAGKHARSACRAVIDGSRALALPTDRVPQLRDVSERLRSLTGFRIEPVPGLVPTRRFYGALADSCFLSTQYIRHTSVPFYTPEPDMIHEVIGHCTMLAEARLAELYRLAGHASLRATTDEALEFFSRVFWFTLEFGVVREEDELRCYGAGLLSSFGEIEMFRTAEIKPFDIVAMGTTAYDITQYQPILFAGDGMDQVVDELTSWLQVFDDDWYRTHGGQECLSSATAGLVDAAD
jgi:phenylalanine-4-hydroxylase